MLHHFLLPCVLIHLLFPPSFSIHLGHGSSPNHAFVPRVASTSTLPTAKFSASERQDPHETSSGLQKPIEIFGDRSSQVVQPSDAWFVRDPEFFHEREHYPGFVSREEGQETPKVSRNIDDQDKFNGEHEIEIDGFSHGWFDDPEFFNDPLPLASLASDDGKKGWYTDSAEGWMDDPEFYGDQLVPQEHESASGEANAEDSYSRRFLRSRTETVERGERTGDLGELWVLQWVKRVAAYLNKGTERGSE